jgi:hypothetical protein
LAKGSLAGAQTLLLYLMARTPDAPAVKEIKPTAAISWKSIGFGPVTRGGKEIMRVDAVRPMSLDEAFGSEGAVEYTEVNEPLEGVYLNAGENGLFSPAEFETLTALGLMEFVTPEEIAQNVLREIMGHPTGRDVVAALDASTMGPTYRAGVLRTAVLERMETLESEHGTRSIAYEMLGPPRLAKLLFEAEILRRLYGGVSAGAELDPVATAQDGARLIQDDTLLRQGILSIGLIILLPDGGTVLRASHGEAPAGGSTLDERVVDASWVDLRESNWVRWKERLTSFRDELSSRRGIEYGSRDDYQYGDGKGQIRPGRMAGWIFRYEDKGERIKR